MRRLTIALLLLTTAASARVAAPPALVAFAATPDHRAAALAVARRDPSWFLRGCGDGSQFAAVPGLTLWAAPSFAPDGRPVDGMWSEQIRASGCGVSRLLTVVSTAGADAVVVKSAAPGLSRAWPGLQEVAARDAWAAATAWNPPGCKGDYVDDTVGLGRHATDDAPAWSERWTLRICGQPIAVIIDYRILYAGNDVRARRVTPRYPNELAHPRQTP